MPVYILYLFAVKVIFIINSNIDQIFKFVFLLLDILCKIIEMCSCFDVRLDRGCQATSFPLILARFSRLIIIFNFKGIEVYEKFQKELMSKKKQDYTEALNENCEIFLDKIFLSNITSNDVADIMQAMKDDARHMALDKLPEERKGLVLKHIAFLLGKSKSSYCAYGNACADIHMDNYLKTSYLLNKSANETNRLLHEKFEINLVFLVYKSLAAHLVDLVKVYLFGFFHKTFLT
jgi:hypothetical protein